MRIIHPAPHHSLRLVPVFWNLSYADALSVEWMYNSSTLEVPMSKDLLTYTASQDYIANEYMNLVQADPKLREFANSAK